VIEQFLYNLPNKTLLTKQTVCFMLFLSA